ncbi:MAG: DUF308 domain-containing protein [Pseudomonadota bacterium]
MSTTDQPPLRDPIFGELTANWKWMLALGLFMAVLGVIGLGMTYWLTFISVLWFGVLALIGGVAQLIDAFKCAGWKGVLAHVLLGLLYLGAGIVLIAMPLQSAWWLTLMIGAVFIVTGILRVIMALQTRNAEGQATVWLIVSGVISIILGLLIYSIVDFPSEEMLATAETAQEWFKAWGWVIGMFVAIEFIVHGAALAALALAARKINPGSTPPAAGAGTGSPEAA